MDVKATRCRHCGITYSYQISGDDCLRPENDDRYCPDCAKVVLAALAGVPRRREVRWVRRYDVRPDQLTHAPGWEKPLTRPACVGAMIEVFHRPVEFPDRSFRVYTRMKHYQSLVLDPIWVEECVEWDLVKNVEVGPSTTF